MWLLILEALLALGLLVFIVAWTMSGRRRSEEALAPEAPPHEPARPPEGRMPEGAARMDSSDPDRR